MTKVAEWEKSCGQFQPYLASWRWFWIFQLCLLLHFESALKLWSSEKKWNNNILTITSWKIRDAWMILQNLSCSQGSSFILRELECWWKFEQLRMKIRFSLYSSAAQLWSLSAFFPSLCIALSLPISWVNMQNVNKAKKMSETGILNFSTISPP